MNTQTKKSKDLQLTPYRKWLNGYSGFFYYLDETETIYLIDNPARSNEQIELNVDGLLLNERKLFEIFFSNMDPGEIEILTEERFRRYKLTPLMHELLAQIFITGSIYNCNFENTSYNLDTLYGIVNIIECLSEFLDKHPRNAPLFDAFCKYKFAKNHELVIQNFLGELFNRLNIICKNFSIEKIDAFSAALLHAHSEDFPPSWWEIISCLYSRSDFYGNKYSFLDMTTGYIASMYWLKKGSYLPHVAIADDAFRVILTATDKAYFFDFNTNRELQKIMKVMDSDDSRCTSPTEIECKIELSKRILADIQTSNFTINVPDSIKEKAILLAYNWITYLDVEHLVHKDTHNTDYVTVTNHSILQIKLPTILIPSLDKLVRAGKLNGEYMPIDSNWGHNAIIVMELYKHHGIKRTLWRDFERYWNHNNLRSNYDGAFNNSSSSGDYQLEIQRILQG